VGSSGVPSAAPSGRVERRVGWELALLPPLLLVWANLHGGFLVGLGIFGLYGAALAARALVPLLRTAWLAVASAPIGVREIACVGAFVVAGILAPLVNPYEIELYTYLGETLDMHDAITEWYPVPLLSTAYLRFKLLVLAVVI